MYPRGCFASLAPRSHRRHLLARLAAFPGVLDASTAAFRSDAAAGVVPPSFALDATLIQLGRLRQPDAAASPLAAGLARKAAAAGLLVAANAVLAGLLNIIPNVGPTLSTLFPMSVALLDAPWKALAVLALYVVVQNLESYLITPSVMHHQLKLLPGLTLSAQLLFTLVFGPLGLVLALPLAVCLQVILREVVIHDVMDPWKAPPRRRLATARPAEP